MDHMTNIDGEKKVRILVCGGRDFSDRDAVYGVLNSYDTGEKEITIISGGAQGADTLAHDWALVFRKDTMIFHADWKTHGKAAGPIRNAEMLRVGKPDFVVAFPGGRGTAHMVSIAEAAGVPVIEFGEF